MSPMSQVIYFNLFCIYTIKIHTSDSHMPGIINYFQSCLFAFTHHDYFKLPFRCPDRVRILESHQQLSHHHVSINK